MHSLPQRHLGAGLGRVRWALFIPPSDSARYITGTSESLSPLFSFSSFLLLSNLHFFSLHSPPLHLHSKWKPVMPLTVSNRTRQQPSDCLPSPCPLVDSHGINKEQEDNQIQLIDLGDQSKDHLALQTRILISTSFLIHPNRS